MALYRYYPIPGDRMGFLWCATQIKDIGIIEFGPMGTTNFATRHMGQQCSIHSTHISDHILTFGDSKNLELAVKEMDDTGEYKAIFVMLSSSTAIIGFDIESFCLELQPLVKSKLVPISFCALGKDYSYGINKTMMLVMKEFVVSYPKVKNSYNILGACNDEYLIKNDVIEIKRILKNSLGLNANLVYPLETSYEEVKHASQAEINIVLRNEAIPVAEYMLKEFSIPYIIARPYGINATCKMITDIAQKLQIDVNKDWLNSQINSLPKINNVTEDSVCILGNFSMIQGICDFLNQEIGINNICGFVFQHTKIKENEYIKKYSEKLFDEWMIDNKPNIVLGNSILTDYNNINYTNNVIKIPICKPYGVAGRDAEPNFCLMGFNGYKYFCNMYHF